jgi:hypothetical protein
MMAQRHRQRQLQLNLQTPSQRIHSFFLAFLAFFHSTWYTVNLVISPIFLAIFGSMGECGDGLLTANNGYAMHWYLATTSLVALVDLPRLPLKAYAKRLNILRSTASARTPEAVARSRARTAQFLRQLMGLMDPIWRALWMFSLIWLIVGTFWIAKSSVCSVSNPGIYYMAWAQVIIQWILVTLWFVLAWVDLLAARHLRGARRGGGDGRGVGLGSRSERRRRMTMAVDSNGVVSYSYDYGDDNDDILQSLRVAGIDSDFWAPVDPDSLRPPGEGLSESDWNSLKVFEFKKGMRKNSVVVMVDDDMNSGLNAMGKVHCNSDVTVVKGDEANHGDANSSSDDDEDDDEADDEPLSKKVEQQHQHSEKDSGPRTLDIQETAIIDIPTTTSNLQQDQIHEEQSANAAAINNKDNKPAAATLPADVSSDTCSCSICLCDYEDGEKIRELKCGHWFHDDCSSRWLKAASDGGQGKKTCPLCVKSTAR